MQVATQKGPGDTKTAVTHPDGTSVVVETTPAGTRTTVTHPDGAGTSVFTEEMAAASDEGSWLPLESNPEVLNPFVHKMGLPSTWGFHDVFGLDDELLMMVPQPCAALCLLFPSDKISGPRRQELRQRAGEIKGITSANLFFLQQHDDIGNACGTIACVHALANGAIAGHFSLEDGPLKVFMEKTQPMGIGDRGRELCKTKEMQEMSDETAASGETEGAGTDDAMNSHFISFVQFEGCLYELDGRVMDDAGVAFPICHGPTTPETWMSDAAKVIRSDFMARDPDNPNFNVTALAQNPSWD